MLTTVSRITQVKLIFAMFASYFGKAKSKDLKVNFYAKLRKCRIICPANGEVLNMRRAGSKHISRCKQQFC